MEDKKWPIYSFSAKWSQKKREGDSDYPKWHEGLPEGRIWNSTSFSKMFKEEQTQEQLDAFMHEWWERMIEAKNKEGKFPIIEPADITLTAKFLENESWVLTWFCHETFDIGQTDEEAIKSFEDYVRRVEDHNADIEWKYPEDEWYKNGHRTLMGAEDRWRWKGSYDGEEGDGRAPYPCRCKFCKEQGVLRIAH